MDDEPLSKFVDAIAAIRSYKDVLQNSELSPEQQKLVARISENVDQLDQQLKELLTLVSAQPSAVDAPVDIPQIVELAKTQVATDLREAGIVLDCEIPETLPQAQVASDLLRQVVVILLERAVRISPAESSIRLSADTDEGGWISIAVSDEGPGISAEDLGKAFQSEAAAEGGDMGLPQVKAHMEALSGRVWIASEIGAGSTVTVLVPASQGTDEDAA